LYEVKIKKRILKNIEKLPVLVKKKLANLAEDLRDNGPIQKNWSNYSKLNENNYHCHLSKKWIACWSYEKGTLIIEVYYAGSRENAPY